jgi:hypothetical protein
MTVTHLSFRARAFQAIALLTLFSCASPGERPSPAAESTTAADRAELLRLHERARAAHLQRRADWLVSEWADTIFSLSHGGVSVGTRENRARSQAGFQEYLDASTFQAWDDIVLPRIRISPDGQMAYVIVEKRVHLTARDSTGRVQADEPDSPGSQSTKSRRGNGASRRSPLPTDPIP